MLNPDRPITTSDEDVLGFKAFACALAQSISLQPQGNGLVIAVNGAWGSGKTSAVNLVLEQLKLIETSPDAPGKPSVIVTFSPWLFSGQHNLASQFFAALAPALERSVGKKAAAAARAIKDIIVRNSSEIVGAASAAAAVTGQSGLALILEGFKTLFKAPVKDDTSVLLDRREELRSVLRDQPRKIVVVIDDIDRLQPEEMKLVMSMLKSVADLPNVIYILPADLSVIRASTEEQKTKTGESFLGKIIQVNLDLPTPSRSGLDFLFSNAINEIANGATFEQGDLELTGYYTFNAYMSTPRSINLIVNAMRVIWPSIGEEGYFPDLLGVEAIRLFEPEIYQYIRTHKSKMIGSGSNAERDELTKALGQLVQRGKQPLELLRQLFPVFGITYPRGSKFTARRVGDDEGFDLYFRWNYDADVVRSSEIRQFQEQVNKGESAAEFVSELTNRRAKGGPGTTAVMSLLEAIVRHVIVPPSDNSSAIEALLLNFEKITIPQNQQDFFLPARTQLNEAVRTLLKGLRPDVRVEQCGQLLGNDAISIDSCVSLLNALVRLGDDRKTLIPSDSLKDLVGSWATKRLSGEEGLIASSYPNGALQIVSHLLGKDFAHNLVAPLMGERTFVERLALDMMTRVRSSSRPSPYRELTEIPDPMIYDLDSIIQTLSEGRSRTLNDIDASDIGLFVGQLKSLLSRSSRDAVAERDQDSD